MSGKSYTNPEKFVASGEIVSTTTTVSTVDTVKPSSESNPCARDLNDPLCDYYVINNAASSTPNPTSTPIFFRDPLTSARTKAKIAQLQGMMSSLRAIAEILYSEKGSSYKSLCSDGLLNSAASNDLSQVVQGIIRAQGVSTQAQAGVQCVSATDKFAVNIKFTFTDTILPNEAHSFCVDSNGVASDEHKWRFDLASMSCKPITN